MSKDQGQISELRFQLAATVRGFTVSKPHGDNSPYDFILDNGSRLYRIQVKSTAFDRGGSYIFHLYSGAGRRIYTAAQVHFFALYIVPEDTFFIIPFTLLRGRKDFSLSMNGKFKAFKENWDFSPGKIRYERDEGSTGPHGPIG
jgi:PD-(D/E)XK endonuclease